MSDLVEFLRARLDEDEAVAKAAITENDPHWVALTTGRYFTKRKII